MTVMVVMVMVMMMMKRNRKMIATGITTMAMMSMATVWGLFSHTWSVKVIFYAA